ncbi:MAG: hypothetical protein AB1758_06980 [Candidatus Eremiobacterota bacterium]
MKHALWILAFGLLAGFLLHPARAASEVTGVALAPATNERGGPACWVMVGNKVYFVEKDSTTVLKVSASGSF